jgi:23S rRNA pseudouridine2605 synthase
MARTGKPSGSKKTSFGRRTEAERSFRERRRGKPEPRNDFAEGKRFTGAKKFSSGFDKDKGRGEGRPSFGARPESGKTFGKKPGEGFRREGGAPRENRFSRQANFNKPRFDQGKSSGGGSFGGKTESKRFGERKASKFSGKRDGNRGDSFGERKFSKREGGDFSSPKFNRSNSSGPGKFSKPFERRKEDGERFSKFKREGKSFGAKPGHSLKFEKPEHVESNFKKPYSSKKSKGLEPETLKAGDGLVRLNKFMANSGVGSRREADELIKMGLVTVNGETITAMGHKVKLTDDVRYEGRKLKAEALVYVLLNKPKGFITTTDDPEERKTIMDLVANACKERIYPVGRLDRNTTGLLLLTNDGDLADKLTHPSYNAKKIYKVELNRPLTKSDFQKIIDGVYFEEGRAQVDDLAIVSDDGKEIGIEIHIGWNRIVRRIFEALGYEIIRLDRVAYAGLDKKDLGRGQWRFLKPEEIVRLKHFQV